LANAATLAEGGAVPAAATRLGRTVCLVKPAPTKRELFFGLDESMSRNVDPPAGELGLSVKVKRAAGAAWIDLL